MLSVFQSPARKASNPIVLPLFGRLGRPHLVFAGAKAKYTALKIGSRAALLETIGVPIQFHGSHDVGIRFGFQSIESIGENFEWRV
jgi:hypothetical protein